MKPHDIFEANDLFENGNMTQVQTTLVALAGLVSICTSGAGRSPTYQEGIKYCESEELQKLLLRW